MTSRASPPTHPSASDIAFHTLRQYEPGDDRRYVHWLTSARVGELMVRQFIDTRRTNVAVVVDGTRTAYADDDEFEVAVSVGASLGVRILLDDQELSMVVGGERIPTATGNAMLDSLSAIEFGHRDAGLGAEIDHLFRFAQGLSRSPCSSSRCRTPAASFGRDRAVPARRAPRRGAGRPERRSAGSSRWVP